MWIRCYAGFNIFHFSCNPDGIGEAALGSLVSVLSEERIGRAISGTGPNKGWNGKMGQRISRGY